jgi:hypothetical protein
MTPAAPTATDNDEIEITPAMILAGVIALANFDDYFECSEEGVERVFRAMWAARKLRKDEAA